MEDRDPLILRKQARTEWLGGISLSTLLRYEKAGRLQPVRLSPKVVGYRRSALERLLAGPTQTTTKTTDEVKQ